MTDSAEECVWKRDRRPVARLDLPGSAVHDGAKAQCGCNSGNGAHGAGGDRGGGGKRDPVLAYRSAGHAAVRAHCRAGSIAGHPGLEIPMRSPLISIMTDAPVTDKSW